MKSLFSRSIVAALAALYFASVAQAQQPVTIALSTVGNPGNAADTAVMFEDHTTGYGSVGYTFNIGTYDVTLTQYTAFLNAVAQTDTYGLYNSSLATDTKVAGVQQLGLSGSYTYSVLGDGQRPVTYVTWLDAARFCNWIQNGELQTHVEDATTTETGAYTLNGDTTSGLETKNLLAQWYIPSENEWYKAAYYDPTLNSGLGGYWTYPTRSNTAPANSWTNRALANEANYWLVNSTLSGTSGYLTPVRSFTNSASYYGTYDQAGDVSNWNDAVRYNSQRGVRGGSWEEAPGDFESSNRYLSLPVSNTEGFRVANVPAPEPTSVMLIVLGAGMLASGRRRLRNW